MSLKGRKNIDLDRLLKNVTHDIGTDLVLKSKTFWSDILISLISEWENRLVV